MKNTNSSPVYESTSSPRYGHEAIIRIHDLEGNAEIVVTADDNTQLTVPAKFLSMLGSIASSTSGEITQKIDEIQRAHLNPTKRHKDLKIAARNPRWNSSQDEFAKPNASGADSEALKLLSTVLSVSGSDINQDGTPYLEWGQHSETKANGWRLRIAGVADVNLSWAAWDDSDGIEELVAMSRDPENCAVIAAVVEPAKTAQMTSRIVARSLRTGRKLPGINMKKIRQIFKDNAAHLLPTVDSSVSGSWNFSRYRPQAKILSIVSGEKRVPVAVAVVPPQTFPQQRQLDREAASARSLQDRRDFDSLAYAEHAVPWLEKSTEAFIAAGWRKIDLPKPRYYWGNGENSVQWFTLLNEELWSSVAPAAKNYASTEFTFSRSTTID